MVLDAVWLAFATQNVLVEQLNKMLAILRPEPLLKLQGADEGIRHFLVGHTLVEVSDVVAKSSSVWISTEGGLIQSEGLASGPINIEGQAAVSEGDPLHIY